jgi:hypothetical protein
VLEPLVPSLLEVKAGPMPVGMGVVRIERAQRHFPGSKLAVAAAVAAVGNYWTTRVRGSANAWAAVSTR